MIAAQTSRFVPSEHEGFLPQDTQGHIIHKSGCHRGVRILFTYSRMLKPNWTVWILASTSSVNE